MTKEINLIEEWGKKINWEKRVKAICKPCWELKYCPYGPLVEDSPIKTDRDYKSCRIFGHDCPVFYVAEPITETKELRRITRSIPRVIQFKVLKRENQICSRCAKSVKDDEIEFDHIIPWSKGGPTEEHNIRLLCSSCNRKRGAKFEDEYLIESFTDHVKEPHSVDIIKFVKVVIKFGHEYLKENGKIPIAQDYADEFVNGKLTEFEQHTAQMFTDLFEFFNQNKPNDLNVKEFKFLKYRWGFNDGHIYSLIKSCVTYNYEIEKGIELDRYLMNKLDFKIRNNTSDNKKWAKY
jgi:hypothetical protein